MLENISYSNLNKDLFEQLFKEHFVHLCNFARNYVPDLDDAKEIVQDVFINLWNKRETISSEKSVKSYLFTSVKNRCFNFIRDNKKFRSNVLDIDIADYEMPYENDSFSGSELQTKINNAINKLPEKCRQVFKLSRIEELKYKEIAEKLNISVKTVEAQMSKALKVLREELKEYITVILLFLMSRF